MRSDMTLLAVSAAVVVLSSLLSFDAGALSGAPYPASASTSGTATEEDKEKSKDTPAPKKDDAPKAPDANLANWLAQAAALRMGVELGKRLPTSCSNLCYLGNWRSFNAAKDAGILLDSALTNLSAQIENAIAETDRISLKECKIRKSTDRTVLNRTESPEGEKAAGGVTIPWLTAIKTATSLVKDIVGQFASQVTMGPMSGSALTVEDIIAATNINSSKIITEDSLRAGSFFAHWVLKLNKELSELDASIERKRAQLKGADPKTCSVEIKQLADLVNEAKTVRSEVQSVLKMGGSTNAVAGGLSSGELALGARHLSQLKNLTIVDITLGSSAVSKGEYKPWYAGARMLMQAVVQVRYQIISPPSSDAGEKSGSCTSDSDKPEFATVTSSGLIGVICQSVAPVKDAKFYAKDFSSADQPESGQTVNCAAVPASSSTSSTQPSPSHRAEAPQPSPTHQTSAESVSHLHSVPSPR